jgi:hypothetical protein
MAFCVLVMSLRKASLAIKPAGSSLPALIRKPVLKRVRDCCNWSFDRARVFCAVKELTLVLIRVMTITPLKEVYVQASPDCGKQRFRTGTEGLFSGKVGFPAAD